MCAGFYSQVRCYQLLKKKVPGSNMRVKLKGIALKRTKIRVVLNLIIHLDTQNWHHQVMEINCFASVCGVQVMPYGCMDTDTFGGIFFLIGWLVKRQMVVFSFFVSVFQIWSGTSPRSKLATQHWKRYNGVCACVCVCVYAHMCVCVFDVQLYFFILCSMKIVV